MPDDGGEYGEVELLREDAGGRVWVILRWKWGVMLQRVPVEEDVLGGLCAPRYELTMM